MNVLITGASSLLGNTLVSGLKDAHALRLLDTQPIETTSESLQGDIRDPQICFRATQDVDVVVHLCELPPETTNRTAWEQEVIDLATRGTHNLLKAAADAGVKRAVFVSTLRMFLKYPPNYAVTEGWKPRPDPDDPFQLAKFLGELTARQFARCANIRVFCIRVGNMVLEEECRDLPFDPLWVDVRDVAQLIGKHLDYPASSEGTYRWSLLHVIPDTPRHRFISCLGRNGGLEGVHRFDTVKEAS